METAYAKTVEQVLSHFHVDAKQGLNPDQLLEYQKLYGKNELAPDPGTPFWKLVLKQFDDLLVKILLVAAVVDFLIALANGEGGIGAFLEPAVILLILIANASVGVITETNAEKAIEELKAYEADVATVLRQGRWTVLPATELVPGDIVEVVVGGKIPADIRIIEKLSAEIRIDQSILTGESDSVGKDPAPVTAEKAVYQDKTNMFFSGTVVTAGRAHGIVVGTGALTAIGRIRDAMVESQEEETPLKKKLDDFGTFLSKVIAVICILVWVVNLPHFNDPLHGSWFGGALYYFKIAVALAVAAIPEGLPAVVTTCLALGSRQMAKRNAIVRRLPSVETLGCTTVICSDKTGTLTTNQMSVVRVATVASIGGNSSSSSSSSYIKELEVTGTSYAPEGKVLDGGTGVEIEYPADLPALLQTAACAALCNDSHLQYSASRGVYQPVGEATEVALRVFAEKVGLPGYTSLPQALSGLPATERATYCNTHWEQQHRKLFTLEFSRDRKMMSCLCQAAAGGGLVLFSKGAPESVLERCSQVLMEDGKTVPLSDTIKQDLYSTVTHFGGGRALRCLALAVRPWNSGVNRLEVTPADEQELTFVGLVGMHDPPRPEVKDAVEKCRAAGIRVIMVTGDNKATAEAICQQVGLSKTNGSSYLSSPNDSRNGRPSLDIPDTPTASTPVGLSGLTSTTTGAGLGAGGSGSKTKIPVALSGLEFDELDNEQQAMAAAGMTVFSRVEPNHKSKLVELLRAQGHVVAMTGDGVNDAPALRRADIGVAMGSGTAVAKHAADMVLADNNFATIVAAIAAGRSIYANTKQFIRYMVSSNIGEVVAIFSAALLGIPECLNPVQLLWVNLVTDGLPATAIGFNKPDADIMRRKPRRADEGIVNRWLFIRYMVIGAYVGAATAAGFIWWFLWYDKGPQITWGQLRDFQHCTQAVVGGTGSAELHAAGVGAGAGIIEGATEESGVINAAAVEVGEGLNGINCSVFGSRHPSTIAMSVLVVVEMFNALNALSENCSLMTLPPWSNPWLLAAITLSMLLHFAILYIHPLDIMFSVTALTWGEWKAVLWLSAPVILVDEILKIISRRYFMEDASTSFAPLALGGLGSGGSSLGGGATTSGPVLRLLQLPVWRKARSALQSMNVLAPSGSGKEEESEGSGLGRKGSGMSEVVPLIGTQRRMNATSVGPSGGGGGIGGSSSLV